MAIRQFSHNIADEAFAVTPLAQETEHMYPTMRAKETLDVIRKSEMAKHTVETENESALVPPKSNEVMAQPRDPKPPIIETVELDEEGQNTDQPAPALDGSASRESEMLEPLQLSNEVIETVRHTTEEVSPTVTPELVASDEHGINYKLFEAIAAIPSMNTSEQSRFVDNDEEDGLPTTLDAYQFNEAEPVEFLQTRLRPMRTTPELTASLVEIDAVMGQLAASIEAYETGEPGASTILLEEIISLPTKLEAASGDETEMLEVKLEELFVELFEEINVSYSPELIESFVKLTKAYYFEKQREVTEDTEAEAQSLPDDIGTREFLQKILHDLRDMKQAAIHFYEIGRSALRLYSLDHSGVIIKI